MDNAIELANLQTTNQFLKRNPAISKGTLRHILFRRNSNGLTDSGAIINLGTRILINPDKFMAWLKEYGSAYKTTGIKEA